VRVLKVIDALWFKIIDRTGAFSTPSAKLLRFYSWLMEPRLYDEGAPGLNFVETPGMIKITRNSIDDMFDKFEFWCTMMAGVLPRHVT
jgi:hypothetical protein